MAEPFFRELVQFFTNAFAIVLALMAIAFLIWAVRRIGGWGKPIDLVDFLWQLVKPGTELQNPPSPPNVNVEYRDALGATLDLGSFLLATLHNGRGKYFKLRAGVFIDCDPEIIKAGTSCMVSIQDGLVKETASVQLDFSRQALFLQSKFTLQEILDQMRRETTSAHGLTDRRSPPVEPISNLPARRQPNDQHEDGDGGFSRITVSEVKGLPPDRRDVVAEAVIAGSSLLSPGHEAWIVPARRPPGYAVRMVGPRGFYLEIKFAGDEPPAEIESMIRGAIAAECSTKAPHAIS